MGASVDPCDTTLEVTRDRVRHYLERIDVDRDHVTDGSLHTLEHLQRAHIATVPFENLSIVGDPHGPYDGEGVSLDLPVLYEKIVDRHRGGYCFELNGLFQWLLSAIGFTTQRLPARILGADGDGLPPANHHAIAVDLDRRYLVDVGMGVPKLRRPVPIDGTVQTRDALWRVVDSERPDADHRLQYRRPGDDSWHDRYLVRDVGVDLGYFRATNDYLQAADASAFTGGVTVNIATETGYLRAGPTSLEVLTPDGTLERPIDAADWHPTLAAYFGVHLPGRDRDDGRRPRAH